MGGGKHIAPTASDQLDTFEADDVWGHGSEFWDPTMLNASRAWRDEVFGQQCGKSPSGGEADPNLLFSLGPEYYIGQRKRNAETARLSGVLHVSGESQTVEPTSVVQSLQSTAKQKRQKCSGSRPPSNTKRSNRQARKSIKQENYESIHSEMIIQEPEPPKTELDISNTINVEDWLYRALEDLDQRALRFILQKIIATLHPNKQTKHAYFKKERAGKNGAKKEVGDKVRGEETKPPYWHPGKPHIDPHHMIKEDRIPLIIHLLHAPYRMRWRHEEDPSTGTWFQFEQLFNRIIDEVVHREMEYRKSQRKPSDSQSEERFKVKRRETLNQIVKVTKAWQRTFDTEITSAKVLVTDFPEKKPRERNKAKRTCNRGTRSGASRSDFSNQENFERTAQESTFTPTSPGHVAPAGSSCTLDGSARFSHNEQTPLHYSSQRSDIAPQNFGTTVDEDTIMHLSLAYRPFYPFPSGANGDRFDQGLGRYPIMTASMIQSEQLARNLQVRNPVLENSERAIYNTLASAEDLAWNHIGYPYYDLPPRP